MPAAQPFDVPASARYAVPDDLSWSDAVTQVGGPQIVLAGPGCGKTQFLAERVAHLLNEGISGADILVLTFSRRAAAELDQRISGLVAKPASGLEATTFHSHALRLLERHHADRGEPMPVLLTGPEQVRVVSELLLEEDVLGWPLAYRSILSSPTLASEVADFLTRCRERLVEPGRLRQLAEGRPDWSALPDLLVTYGQRLEATSRIDYGTLVATAGSLTDQTELASYDYVVVDEYQDCSPAQARLAEASTRDGSITVGTDPNQSVYSFRGADLDTVLAFPERMRSRCDQPVRIINLSHSKRVPAPILDAARRLVAPNAVLADDLQPATVPAPHDGSVEVYTFNQRSAEAEWIASEVARLHVTEGQPLRSMAVLVRSTRHLLPELSRSLERRDIPHDQPDQRLVDHPAIRFIADLVTAAVTSDSTPGKEHALRRIMLGPLVSLSIGEERELLRTHRATGAPWPELFDGAGLPELAELLLDPAWATSTPAADGFWRVWDGLPQVAGLVVDPERADFRRAWTAFARSLERQSERDPGVTLVDVFAASDSGVFEASPLLRHATPTEDRLVVTTLHQAKGLEFDVVFIADSIDGIFPDTRRSRSLLRPEDLLADALTTDRSTRDARLEEERRLAYTATTRARHRVVWTATTAGIDETTRRPSRFLLAVAATDSFDAIASPPSTVGSEFAPLSLADAEAQLRRMLIDPSVSDVRRLAALQVLTQNRQWWAAEEFAGVPQPGDDTGLIDPGAIRLSPSQASSFESCPRRYAIERRLHLGADGSVYADFGTLFHEVMELTEREAHAAGLDHAEIDDAIRHLDAIWDDRADFGTPALNKHWYDEMVQALTAIYEPWPAPGRRAVGFELDLTMQVDGVDWLGRADRIDLDQNGRVVVVDYKTTKTLHSDDYQGSIQLGFYALAAAGHPDLTGFGEPAGAELWAPRVKRRKKAHPFDMGKLDEIRQRMADVADGINSEQWEPRVGKQCTRCAVRSTCPAWPDGREAYR